MILEATLDEYPTNINSQEFAVEVLPCKVLDFNAFEPWDVTYYVYNETVVIDFHVYQFFPDCQYETYWQINM